MLVAGQIAILQSLRRGKRIVTLYFRDKFQASTPRFIGRPTAEVACSIEGESQESQPEGAQPEGNIGAGRFANAPPNAASRTGAFSGGRNSLSAVNYNSARRARRPSSCRITI